MLSADETRSKLLDYAAAHGLEAYKENARIINVIEDKAQKNTTVAGVFIGAVLTIVGGTAFLTSLRPHSLVSGLIVVGTIFLLLSVGCGMLAMRIKAGSTFIGMETVLTLISTLMENPDYVLRDPEKVVRIRMSFIEPWIAIHQDQFGTIAYKSKCLNIAQAFLVLALATFGTAIIKLILGRLS